MMGTLEKPGRRGLGEQGERRVGLRGRRLSDVRDRGWGGMENRGTITQQMLRNGDRSGGSHVHGCMEEGRRAQLNFT